jgi:hypothetical protein
MPFDQDGRYSLYLASGETQRVAASKQRVVSKSHSDYLDLKRLS